MRVEKWVGLSLLLIAGLSYALSGLFFSAPRQVKRPLDTLFVGTTMPQTTFSIASQDGAFGRMNYNAFVQATLVDRDEQNQVLPDMATAWEISEDNRAITFTLAEGIRWHDGTALTLDDVKFTFDLLKKNPSSSLGRLLERVEYLDDRRFRLYFTESAAFGFLQDKAGSFFFYPKHIWEKVEVPSKYRGEDAAIGCGPYRLTGIDLETNRSFYEAVPDHFRGPVGVPKVIVQSYTSQEAMLADLRTGQIDAVYDYSRPIRPTLVSFIAGRPDVALGRSLNRGNHMLVFGFHRYPTSDIHFRQAVSYALRYELMVQTIAGKEGKVAGRGVISPGNMGFDPSLERLQYAPERAEEILTQSGFSDRDGDGWRELPNGTAMDVGITLLSTKRNNDLTLRMAEIIQTDLRQVGIRTHVDLETMRNEEIWRERVINKQDYELFIGYNTTGIARFETAAFYFMPKETGYPWGTWHDERFIQTYRRLIGSHDEAAYVKNAKELQRLLAKELPAISLGWDSVYYPYRTDRFFGWVYYPAWGVINPKTWHNIRAYPVKDGQANPPA